MNRGGESEIQNRIKLQPGLPMFRQLSETTDSGSCFCAAAPFRLTFERKPKQAPRKFHGLGSVVAASPRGSQRALSLPVFPVTSEATSSVGGKLD